MNTNTESKADDYAGMDPELVPHAQAHRAEFDALDPMGKLNEVFVMAEAKQRIERAKALIGMSKVTAEEDALDGAASAIVSSGTWEMDADEAKRRVALLATFTSPVATSADRSQLYVADLGTATCWSELEVTPLLLKSMLTTMDHHARKNGNLVTIV